MQGFTAAPVFLFQANAAEAPDPQSMKYFQLLLRQADSEVVYDRFYDAWLDNGTLETLEAFLQDHLAEKPGANARLLLAKFYERQNLDDRAWPCTPRRPWMRRRMPTSCS